MPIVYKPTALTVDPNNPFPLFSIDVSADGKRLVVGGEDGKARVWALASVICEGEPPRLLATLSDHGGSVECVRFSPKGNYLLSCSNDRTSFIYELRPGQGRATLGGAPNLDNWVVLHALHGHTGDVMDGAWSPDGALVATCSIDNSIIVYEASTGRQVAILAGAQGHQGHAKGLAWDPLGRYLVSQGGDGKAIVWDAESWSVDGVVESPFAGTGASGSCARLRPSWATDGSALALVGAASHGKHTVAMITRKGTKDSVGETHDTWHLDCHIRGHKREIQIASFGPRMVWNTEGADPDEPKTVWAQGSNERTVTVWCSASEQPVACIKKMFRQPLSDFAWAPDGLTLLMTSIDGTVGAVTFEEAELGRPLSEAQWQRHMVERYGKSFGAVRGAPVAEAAELDAVLEQPRANGGGTPGAPVARAAPTPAGPSAAAQAKSPPVSSRLAQRIGTAVPQWRPSMTGAVKYVPCGVCGNKAARGTPPQPPPGEPQPGGRPYGSFWTLRAPAPPQTLEARVRGGDGDGDGDVMCVTNRGNADAGAADVEVKAGPGGARRWSDRLPSRAVLAVATPRFAAVACENSRVYVFTPGGRRALPPLHLGMPACYMHTDGDWALMVASAGCQVAVYDILSQSCLTRCSLGGLFGPAAGPDALRSVFLRANKVVCAVLDSGEAFLFHPAMECWTVAASNDLPLSALTTVLAEGAGAAAAGSAQPADSITAAELNASVAELGTAARGHVESLLVSARLRGRTQDLPQLLRTYIKVLADSGDADRMRELCMDLKHTGGEMRGLLEDVVLPEMAKSDAVRRDRDLVRVAAETRELLDADGDGQRGDEDQPMGSPR